MLLLVLHGKSEQQQIPMNNKHSYRVFFLLNLWCPVSRMHFGFCRSFFWFLVSTAWRKYHVHTKHLQQTNPFWCFNLDFYFQVLFMHRLWRKHFLFWFVLGQKGVVLVHCNAGVSRSSSIAIGYLMQREGLSFEDAYSQVKVARPSIHPNRGFYQQLQSYNPQGCWTVFYVLVFTVGSKLFLFFPN